MTPPWLLSPKKAAPIYERLLAEIRKVERLAKICGRKLTPRKQ